jgi:ABC-type antimicrobial peptide transport system ATPase subunit
MFGKTCFHFGISTRYVEQKISLTLTDAKELHFLVSSLRVYMSLNQRAVTKIVKKFNKVSQDRVEDKSHDLRDTAMLDTLTTLIHNYKVCFYSQKLTISPTKPPKRHLLDHVPTFYYYHFYSYLFHHPLLSLSYSQ